MQINPSPDNANQDGSASPRSNRWRRALLVGGGVVLGLACGWFALFYGSGGAIRKRAAEWGLLAKAGPAQLAKPAPAAQGFVGSAACAECHEAIADRYRSHPMAHSLAPVRDAAPLEDYDEQTSFAPSAARTYRVERNADGVRHHEIGVDTAGEVIYDQAVPVHYALGSGRHGRSYVIDRGGRLYMSPISWYTKNQRWDLSPGYTADDHTRFERIATDRCLQCHAGRMAYAGERSTDLAQQYQPAPFAEHSIGCERCHGPGDAHVKWRRSHTTAKATVASADPIVNPSRLDPARRDAVCNQCHLQGDQQILRYGRRHDDFRPGQSVGEIWSVFVSGTGIVDDETTQSVSHVGQMHSSTCFQKSAGRLGCISCHDPHSVPAVSQQAEFYRSRCLQCHQDRGCSAPPAERQTADDSCVACHMPRLKASDIPHTTQTDHRVRRRPAAETLSEAGPRRVGRPVIADQADCPLAELEAARAYGLALASQASGTGNRAVAQQVEALLLPVWEAAPDDVDVAGALAVAAALQRRRAEAVRLWQRAVELDPRREEALYALALHFQDAGETGEARNYLDRLIAVNPWRAELYGRRSMLFATEGDFDQARIDAEKTLELDPTILRTYVWLAELHDRRNEPDLGERIRQTGRRLEASRTATRNVSKKP